MLGNKLKEMRLLLGWTQERTAELLKIPRGTYAHYELDKREPDNEMLLKIASLFNVSVDCLLENNLEGYCNICGLEYVPYMSEDVTAHKKRHKKVLDARAKHGFFYTAIERESIKHQVATEYDCATKEKKIELAIKFFKQYFSRSLESSGFDKNHISFSDYAGMLLYTDDFKQKFIDIYYELLKSYTPTAGLKEGTTLYTVNKKNDSAPKLQPTRNNVVIDNPDIRLIARAGSKLSDEQAENLRKYAQFMFPEAFDAD